MAKPSSKRLPMPKHHPLFNGSLVLGLAGVWLFALVNFWRFEATVVPGTGNAVSGLSMFGQASWVMVLLSSVGLIASFGLVRTSSKTTPHYLPVPKQPQLFYGSLVLGLAGALLFAFPFLMGKDALWALGPIGLGMLGLTSWGMGLLSVVGMVASFFKTWVPTVLIFCVVAVLGYSALLFIEAKDAEKYQPDLQCWNKAEQRNECK